MRVAVHLLLAHGSQQRVAKSHVADVLRLMGSDSATNGADLPTTDRIDENQQTAVEMPMSSLS